MTALAIQDTTEAFRDLLETALVANTAITNNAVFAGPPSDQLANAASASLFLYHLVPKRRSAQRIEPCLTTWPGKSADWRTGFHPI